MAKIAKNLTELIGHTPLMELAEYSRKYGLKRNIVAKLESFNPAGSVKDRVAFAMIEDAEARGALKPGPRLLNLPVAIRRGTGDGSNHQGISFDIDHAGDHECGTP